MLKRILQNALDAVEAAPTFPKQLSIFSTLCTLNFKAKFLESNDQLCAQKFHEFKAYGHSYLSLTYLYEEIFREKNYFFQSQTDTPLIIDCGANIGVSMLYFKHLFPNAQVHCFEPNPDTFQILEKNKAENHLNGVFLNLLALSNQTGEIAFYTSGDAATLVSSLNSKRGGNQRILTPTMRLSDYLKGFEKVDLLKIDVEGSEWAIVEDLDATHCFDKIDQLIVEYHHKIEGEVSQFSQFLKIFEDNGFEYNLTTHYSKTNDFQDILIHFYRATPDSIAHFGF